MGSIKATRSLGIPCSLYAAHLLSKTPPACPPAEILVLFSPPNGGLTVRYTLNYKETNRKVRKTFVCTYPDTVVEELSLVFPVFFILLLLSLYSVCSFLARYSSSISHRSNILCLQRPVVALYNSLDMYRDYSKRVSWWVRLIQLSLLPSWWVCDYAMLLI